MRRPDRESRQQIGHNCTYYDLGLHPDRNPPLIGGEPHPDIAFIDEKAFKWHDHKYLCSFSAAPRPLHHLDPDLDLTVLLVVMDVHHQRSTWRHRKHVPDIIKTRNDVLGSSWYWENLRRPIFHRRNRSVLMVKGIFKVFLILTLPTLEKHVLGKLCAQIEFRLHAVIHWKELGDCRP